MGTWTGPAATAVHNAPVPFRELPNGHTDYGHWAPDACPSTLSYGCSSQNDPQPIDVTYLEDLGYETAPDAMADADEIYSLGAWAEKSGFAITVARDLNDYSSDRLRAETSVFGIEPATPFAAAHAGMTGSANWTGILLGTDLGAEGLPPVTGNAGITIDLADMDGNARFTDLQVLADGKASPFRAADTYRHQRDRKRLQGRRPARSRRVVRQCARRSRRHRLRPAQQRQPDRGVWHQPLDVSPHPLTPPAGAAAGTGNDAGRTVMGAWRPAQPITLGHAVPAGVQPISAGRKITPNSTFARETPAPRRRPPSCRSLSSRYSRAPGRPQSWAAAPPPSRPRSRTRGAAPSGRPAVPQSLPCA